jgi:chemotaxis protein histidine kinase CheA
MCVFCSPTTKHHVDGTKPPTKKRKGKTKSKSKAKESESGDDSDSDYVPEAKRSPPARAPRAPICRLSVGSQLFKHGTDLKSGWSEYSPVSYATVVSLSDRVVTLDVGPGQLAWWGSMSSGNIMHLVTNTTATVQFTWLNTDIHSVLSTQGPPPLAGLVESMRKGTSTHKFFNHGLFLPTYVFCVRYHHSHCAVPEHSSAPKRKSSGSKKPKKVVKKQTKKKPETKAKEAKKAKQTKPTKRKPETEAKEPKQTKKAKKVTKKATKKVVKKPAVATPAEEKPAVEKPAVKKTAAKKTAAKQTAAKRKKAVGRTYLTNSSLETTPLAQAAALARAAEKQRVLDKESKAPADDAMADDGKIIDSGKGGRDKAPALTKKPSGAKGKGRGKDTAKDKERWLCCGCGKVITA